MYDDIGLGHIPSIIRCIRTSRFKYAVYFTEDGKDADWELYDLKIDPLENENKAGKEKYRVLQYALEKRLRKVMQSMRTEPRGFNWPPNKTSNSRGVR